jgi:hypothetical protein
MYCTNCGQPRPDDANACPNCGRRIPQFTAPNIPNYLVQSILVTLCCCLPLGIVAVIYSARVNGKLVAGDIAGAQAASDKAKKWAWIGFGLGVVINLLGVVFQMFNGLKR